MKLLKASIPQKPDNFVLFLKSTHKAPSVKAAIKVMNKITKANILISPYKNDLC